LGREDPSALQQEPWVFFNAVAIFACPLQDDIAAFIAKHGLVVDDLYGELNTLHGFVNEGGKQKGA
jgi:hypothetical protein